MDIYYAFTDIPLGEILIASNGSEICYLCFTDGDRENVLADLKQLMPHKIYKESTDELISRVVSALVEGKGEYDFPLSLSGTEFQQKVWKTLLEIPFGEKVTYKDIALRLGMPKAVRAIGTAIGQNRIALLVPCHRVVRSTGALAGYRWGIERKKTLLEWEQTKNR